MVVGSSVAVLLEVDVVELFEVGTGVDGAVVLLVVGEGVVEEELLIANVVVVGLVVVDEELSDVTLPKQGKKKYNGSLKNLFKTGFAN